MRALMEIVRIRFECRPLDTFPKSKELSSRFQFLHQSFISKRLSGEEETFLGFKPIERDTESVGPHFGYVRLLMAANYERILEGMKEFKVVPASPEELVGFDSKFPLEKMHYPIAALGATTMLGGIPSVAYTWNHHGAGSLNLLWLGNSSPDGTVSYAPLDTRFRFLVRLPK